jgi:cellulose biosynthesis protein BcsQ
MKVLSIANSAGGVGKTTLAHCLAVSFTEFGKKTLLIDLDPAGAMTFRLGFENPRISIADFLSGSKINDSNLVTTSERFDFIPADSRLVANFSVEALSNVLSKLPKSYDVVILDLPGSLSQPLSMALSVSQLVVVPVRNNLHSLRGYLQIKSISAGVETTPSSSIMRASTASALSARSRTCSAVDAVVPCFNKASASGFGVNLPSLALM